MNKYKFRGWHLSLCVVAFAMCNGKAVSTHNRNAQLLRALLFHAFFSIFYDMIIRPSQRPTISISHVLTDIPAAYQYEKRRPLANMSPYDWLPRLIHRANNLLLIENAWRKLIASQHGKSACSFSPGEMFTVVPLINGYCFSRTLSFLIDLRLHCDWWLLRGEVDIQETWKSQCAELYAEKRNINA